jgi:hypothetical protein
VQLRNLPWFGGSLLFLALITPWYVMAEIRNPGFLKYFLWNENFGRYLKKEYGDEYGSGHRQPFGVAWAMMIPSLFPWSIVVPCIFVLARKTVSFKGILRTLREDSLMLYALTWSVCCPVLLMKAKQYTGTYLVPSLPGCALLVGVLWERQRQNKWISDHVIASTARVTSVVLALLLIVGAFFAFYLYRGDLWVTAGAALIGLTVFIGLLKRNRFHDSFMSSLRMSVITTLVFALAAACFNNYLSDGRSSRRVLRLAETFGTPGTTLRIGFPFYYPFSSTFYGPQLTSSPIEAVPLKDEEVATPNTDLIIIRDKNLKRLLELDPHKELLGSVGPWRIFRGMPQKTG